MAFAPVTAIEVKATNPCHQVSRIATPGGKIHEIPDLPREGFHPDASGSPCPPKRSKVLFNRNPRAATGERLTICADCQPVGASGCAWKCRSNQRAKPTHKRIPARCKASRMRQLPGGCGKRFKGKRRQAAALQRRRRHRGAHTPRSPHTKMRATQQKADSQ